MSQPLPLDTTRQSFDSVEEFSRVARGSGLDVDFQEIKPGTASVSVETTTGVNLSVSRYRVTAPTIRQGAPRRGVVSFWLREARQPTNSYWCGQSIEGPGLSVFPAEFYASGTQNHDGTVVEVGREHLHRLAESEGINLCDADLRGPTNLQLDAWRLGQLSTLKNALIGGSIAVDRSQLEVDLSLNLLLATSAGRERTVRPYRVHLRRATSGETVADVANRWGFWHMGQFARDYQRLFGVRPREDVPGATANGFASNGP